MRRREASLQAAAGRCNGAAAASGRSVQRVGLAVLLLRPAAVGGQAAERRAKAAFLQGRCCEHRLPAAWFAPQLVLQALLC